MISPITMSTNLKIFYACSEVPAKSFSCMVPRDSTCEEVLQTISKLQNANYISLFHDGCQIDKETEIIPYCLPNEILYASTTTIPPTAEFMNSINATKEKIISSPTVDTTANLDYPDSVKQIVMVNLDESQSMMRDLDGHVINNDSEKDNRITIAIQYLTTFINKIYSYHIQSIQGLVSFNNQVKVRCPLSPLVSDFEDKGLKNLKPESTTKLWNSLVQSCDEIVKFRKDSNGNEIYTKAQSRIIVISDGKDVNSNVKVEEIVKELINNKIIVDSIVMGSEDECKMLCAVCHATGGLSIRLESVSKGLSLFEQSAFLNVEERMNFNKALIPDDRKSIPSKLPKNIDIIDAEFMDKAKENANYDTEIINKELLIASDNRSILATPRHICAMNANIKDIKKTFPRNKRILSELHLADEANDQSSSNYDPCVKIYTLKANLDRWKVFIKGPEGTPYKGKWWYLFITFPDLYPVQPPNFKFISVPYHINVSSDGTLCLNFSDKDYNSSKHVVDIIQEIKELFLLPNPNNPVQIETYDMFMNNKDQYEKLASESAEKNAKDKIEDYIDSSKINDEIENFSNPVDDDHVPFYMKHNKLKKENMVLASSGVYYDKDELRQLLASNEKPICVVTGKVLTEKPEDLDDLNAK